MKNAMLDKLFFLILVLNATGLFQFVGPQFGVQIKIVSIVLLALQGVYLLARWRYVWALPPLREVLYILFALLVWPLFTVLYAPALEIREIGLQLYYTSLFCAVVVYAQANGLGALHRVLGVSLVVSVFGLVLSMVMPAYFASVAEIGGGTIQYNGRAFGFFMQPNQAATGLNLLFLGWFSLWKYKHTMWEPIILMGFFAAVLVTGSRTGAVVAAVIVGLTVMYSWRKDLICWWRKGFGDVEASRRLCVKMLVTGVCLIGGLAGLKHYVASASDEKGGLVRRIEMLTDFQIARGDIRQDGSMSERLAAQSVYWSLIEKRPLWGHGFGAEAHYVEHGSIDLTAHSSLLTCWMEYGLFYPIVFGLLFVRMYLHRRRPYVEETLLKGNFILQFVLLTGLLFTVNGGMINTRVFYIVWGMFFAMVCCSTPSFRAELEFQAGDAASLDKPTLCDEPEYSNSSLRRSLSCRTMERCNQMKPQYCCMFPRRRGRACGIS